MYYYGVFLSHKKAPEVTSVIIQANKWTPDFMKKNYPKVIKESTGHNVTSIKVLTKEQFEELGKFDFLHGLRGLELHYNSYKKEKMKAFFKKLVCRLRSN